MKRLFAILTLAIFLCVGASCTTVTSTTQIIGPDGKPLNGTVFLQLPFAGVNTLTSQLVLATPVSARVVNGVIQQPFVVPGNDILSPSMPYRVTYVNNFGQPITYQYYYITGATFDVGSAPASPNFINTNNNVFASLTITPGDLLMCSACNIKWGSSGVGSPDLFVSRDSSGTIRFGTTSGSSNGTLKATIFNALTGLRINSLAPSNHVLLGNGTNYIDSATVPLAVLANLGTTTTVLHGNAAGTPAFSAVSLTTDVSGSLPLGNQAAPTGTGFAHITSGAWDGASKLVSLTASTDTAANQGTTTTTLHGNAAGQPAFSSVVSADMNISTTSCTNQFVTAISAGGVGTCTTDTLASAQHANQGTTVTVLHGNAAGNPSFGVVTPSDAAGNTSGSGSFALTTSPVFTTPTIGAASASTITIVGGGSGSGVGASLSGIPLRVGGSDSTSGGIQIFTGQVGVSATESLRIDPAAANPPYVSGLKVKALSGGLLSGSTTLTIDANGRIQPRFLLTTSASAAPQTLTADSDNLDVNAWNMTGTAGTLTIAAPTGTPVEGQKLLLRIRTTNSWTYSFNATFRFSTTVTAPTTTGAGKTDYIGCMWNGADSKWDVVAVDQGH